MADVNDYGIKISQEGFDVKTCEDKDLVMSSSFNMLKTHMVGSGTNTTVAHNLSYTPIIFSVNQSGNTAGIIGDDYLTTIDGTNITLGATYTTKYYIFYQEAV